MEGALSPYTGRVGFLKYVFSSCSTFSQCGALATVYCFLPPGFSSMFVDETGVILGHRQKTRQMRREWPDHQGFHSYNLP